jgi:hypothetical protein
MANAVYFIEKSNVWISDSILIISRTKEHEITIMFVCNEHPPQHGLSSKMAQPSRKSCQHNWPFHLETLPEVSKGLQFLLS